MRLPTIGQVSFSLQLHRPPLVQSQCELRSYDSELDDLGSLLDDLCDFLAEESGFDFVVGGFGDDRWPVDVATDLPVVLEQLPALCDALAAPGNSSAELDFYEQGLQRRLFIHCSGDVAEIECVSGTQWQPTPATISMSRHELLATLRRLQVDFLSAVEEVAPTALSNPWLQRLRPRESGTD